MKKTLPEVKAVMVGVQPYALSNLHPPSSPACSHHHEMTMCDLRDPQTAHKHDHSGIILAKSAACRAL